MDADLLQEAAEMVLGPDSGYDWNGAVISPNDPTARYSVYEQDEHGEDVMRDGQYVSLSGHLSDFAPQEA